MEFLAPTRRWHRLVHPVVLASGGVFVLGLMIATAVPGPLLTLDDLANFGLARTLAGQGATPMPPQPPYGLLYPVMLAPGWLLNLEGESLVLWARIVNAACGALLVPVLVSLLRRVSSLPLRTHLAAAVAAALLPASTLTASIVWPERLLALLFALLALALVTTGQRPTVLNSAMVMLAGVACSAAHPRLGPVAVMAIIVAAVQLRRALPDRRWILSAGVLAGGTVLLVAIEWLRAAVARRSFASSGTYDLGDLAQRRGWDQLDVMVRQALGVGASLVLATAGLALVGIWVLFGRRTTRLVLLAVAILWAVAAWFITGVPRADRWLHGRYIEVAAPVLVAVGLAHLGSWSQRRQCVVLVGGPVLAGGLALANSPTGLWGTPRSPVMMLGVEVLGAPFGAHIFEPLLATAVAVVVGVVLVWLVRRFGVAALALGTAGFGLLGAASGIVTLDSLYERTPFAEIETVLPADPMIEELWVDPSQVSANLTNALAWTVGFERTVLTPSPATSHALLPRGVPPASVRELDRAPRTGSIVAEFAQGVLWRLN